MGHGLMGNGRMETEESGPVGMTTETMEIGNMGGKILGMKNRKNLDIAENMVLSGI